MKNTKFSLALPAAAFGLFLAATLQAASQAPAAPEPPHLPLSAQAGRRIFVSNCAFCHGDSAKGSASGPSLIDSSVVRHDEAGDLIGNVLRNGRPDKGMPAFANFDSNQVSEIAAFLHARIAITDSVETGGPRGGYQLQKLLTGSPQAGKEFFDGPGGCAKCHSANGDLAAIARKYRPSELEARFLYPPVNLATATVTLPSGEVFKGSLQHRDPFYVALIDRDGFYHSWLLPGPNVTVHDPLQTHMELLSRYTNKELHDVFAYLETLR